MYNYDCVKIVNQIQNACIMRRGARKIAEMLKECNLPTSTIDNIKRGSIPAVDKIAIIADALSCSVDYLLGRTDQIDINNGNQIDVDVNIGDNSANININYSQDDIALLQLIHKLDIVERSRLICEISDKVNAKR